MKYPPCLILCLLFSASALLGQSNKVTVSKKQRKRGEETNLVFTAVNQSVARQTIIMALNGARYARADSGLPVIKVLQPGTNRLLTLTDLEQSPGYEFTWVFGCVNTKPKAITYLLPVASGKATRIDTLFNISETYLGKESPENWLSYALSALPGDTVFAARRGIVIEVKEDETTSTKEGISYSRAHNFVVLEHEDCTRGRYELFANDMVFPALGDQVEAGDPLGTIADGSNYVNGSHLRFSVYYSEITNQLLREGRKNNNTTYKTVYVTPIFQGVDNIEIGQVYQSVHTESLIFQEMNKREIKKWKKERGVK
jgi:hypothetical protein